MNERTDVDDGAAATGAPSPPGGLVALRALAKLAALGAGVALLWVVLGYLRTTEANRVLIVALAVAVGLGGVFFVFWAMDRLVDEIPGRWRERARPYVFIGPALVLLTVFLVYPVVNTIMLSFEDARSARFIGLDNYVFVFTDDSMVRSLRNTAAWIVLVPLAAVTIGLVFATLADRLRRGEAVAKSMIFLPMAISFVGAAVVWRFVYDFRPAGFGSNIGLLNGIVTGLGRDPIPWLQAKPGGWNNLLLMVIMIWMQTGFAMVVLSAAIKAIPEEIVEAARIDGASEMQVFWRILIPSIAPTIVVVTTYMVINAMKVFDIVFVMGNPSATGTEVVAERMIRWFFISDHNGRGAAIAVVLFVAVTPVMVWNVRRFRQLEEIR